MINRNNINRIFSTTSTNEIGVVREFKEIKSSEYFDLLKYLIRHGYIDETYSDYMTYFYENSLSRVDKIFLRSISDSRAKEHTYRLKNPKLVVSRLKIVDFDQEEALNFDLSGLFLTLEQRYLSLFEILISDGQRCWQKRLMKKNYQRNRYGNILFTRCIIRTAIQSA